MQHEALERFFLEEQVEPLLVFLGAERGGRQGLRLAAREERRAVRARQNTHFAGDVADFIERAGIRAPVAVQDVVAEIIFAQAFKRPHGQRALLFVLFRDRLFNRFLDFVDQVIAFLLRIFLGVQGVVEFRAVFLLDFLGERLIERQRGNGHFVRLDLVMQLADRRDDVLDLFVPEFERVGDRVFAHFNRARFDHHDGLLGRDHDDVQQAGLLFGGRGVGDELSIHQANAHGRHRRRERQVGNKCRRRSGRDADHVRIVFAVRRKHHGHDLRFIAPRFGEQRTQRAVDHSGSQNFALRGAPFALEKAAGNFSGRIRIFAIVHGEGKKIAVIRLGIHARRDQHDGIAIARQNGAVGLLCNFSGFQSQRASADFDGNLMGSGCCLRHIRWSFRLSAASRTIGPYARGKPFECGRNFSRFVWKRKR